MKLKCLSANHESFKTINFNPEGISLIVAKQKTQDKKNTFNSVGKSLSIALVDFCLGSSANKAFKEKLPGWVFILDYEEKGQSHTVKRSTDNQNVLTLDGQNIKVDNFRQMLGKQVFNLNDPIPYLTFRSLIIRFLRPYRDSYSSYNTYNKKEKDYQQMLNTAYLFGLNVDIAQKKEKLKEELDNTRKFEKQLQENEAVKSFFLQGNIKQNEDIKIKMVDLHRKIELLQKNIEHFIIAKDYNKIKKEADDISSRLRLLRNQASQFKNAISSIEKSMAIKPSLTKKQLEDFYQEAGIELGDIIKKHLDEVETFNNKLITSRTKSLFDEKQKFARKLEVVNDEIKAKGEIEDEKLQYLNSHGALGDYVGLTEQFNKYKEQYGALDNYQKMIAKYKEHEKQIKAEFASEDEKTEKYINDIDDYRNAIISRFQTLVEHFYTNYTAGITIQNKDGVNSLRYNIEAKISDDAGDGVNCVKIFCYDWTILCTQSNHDVKFLFHDSRLFADIDPRQIVTALNIAYTESKSRGFQYILTINQNILDNLKEIMPQEDYHKIITDSEVLELSDESDQGKLLGVKIDMDY